MKHIIASAALLLIHPAFVSAGELRSQAVPGMVSARVDKNNNPVFYLAKEDGNLKAVETDAVGHVLDAIVAKAKSAACATTPMPAQITISAGVISMTWNRDELCGKSK